MKRIFALEFINKSALNVNHIMCVAFYFPFGLHQKSQLFRSQRRHRSLDASTFHQGHVAGFDEQANLMNYFEDLILLNAILYVNSTNIAFIPNP